MKAFTEISRWFRSQYEYTVENGVTFISPVANNKVEDYSLEENAHLQYLPKSKKEHLSSCPHVALARINLDDNSEILGFVNDWGLLGLWELPKFHQIDDKLDPYKFNIDEIFNSKHKRGKSAKREPLHLFIQAAREYQTFVTDHTRYTEGLSNLPLSQNKHIQILNDLSVEEEIDRNRVIKKTAKRHKVSEEQIDNMVIIYTSAISLNITLNQYLKNCSPQAYFSGSLDNDRTGWHFKSLLSAIYAKTYFGKAFRHCALKKCNQLFIGYIPTNIYCSSRCGALKRQGTMNVNKWKNELTNIFKECNPLWIESQIDLLIEKGVSGRKRLENELKYILEINNQ